MGGGRGIHLELVDVDSARFPTFKHAQRVIGVERLYDLCFFARLKRPLVGDKNRRGERTSSGNTAGNYSLDEFHLLFLHKYKLPVNIKNVMGKGKRYKQSIGVLI